MIRIAICCGGGFSSSALASRMAKELKESGRDNEYSIIFRPIRELIRNHDDIDIAFLCPHLLHSAKRWLDEEPVNFPVYMIHSCILYRQDESMDNNHLHQVLMELTK